MTPLNYVNEFLAHSFTVERLKPANLFGGMSDIKSTIRDDAQRMRKMSKKKQPYDINKNSLIAIRKVLYPYFHNDGSFAVNLREAVQAHFRFIDVMEAYGYVSSPYRAIFANRSIERLSKFFYLLQHEKGKSIAPPNDVDLAWHTLQLSPAKYMALCFTLLGTHVDHDDSGSKGANQEAESRGSKRWRRQFPNDVLAFNDCTCVFCETKIQNGISKASAPLRRSGKTLFSGGKESRSDGIAIDYEYRQACLAAKKQSRKDIVELYTVEQLQTGKTTAPKHPYFAYLPPDIDAGTSADTYKGVTHSNQLDYLGAPKCFTIY